VVPMSSIRDSPFLIFAFALVTQWIAARLGDRLRRKRSTYSEEEHRDFDTIRTASLTLLALLIGFSFSMAVTRYDQRENCEETEANAIGTEYLRANLLATDEAATVHDLLKRYLDQRILFYETRDHRQLGQIDAETARLQTELWSVVARSAKVQATPVIALAISGMNDVLNSQGYTQAAWWNRIPLAAWAMLGIIAVCCNGLIGYGERRGGALHMFVLPAVVSIAMLLIADIDSPRGGIIRILPQNLVSLSQSLQGR
jgi:hypothetical protein